MYTTPTRWRDPRDGVGPAIVYHQQTKHSVRGRRKSMQGGCLTKGGNKGARAVCARFASSPQASDSSVRITTSQQRIISHQVW